ncbi:S-adenosylmethionine:tRNA ribosyltransferase-isomerase [Opitutaceae bacterium TAV1]|nr:S-adenosylmethionine:tRNA ribosyltransferase-isomerase [Opitutaceae bacterium TAV1]
MPLSTDLFDYHLPAHLVAQTPAARRDASRLMVVDRAARSVTHAHFSDLPRWLRAGDILFRNNAAVLPARLHARRPTGGAVECLLLRPEPARGDNVWWCLVRPGKKLPVGGIFAHGADFSAVVLEKDAEGAALVRFDVPAASGEGAAGGRSGGGSIVEVANRLGDVPLPPYIERARAEAEVTDPAFSADAAGRRALDLERYQTVYADRARQVAVAAPTAGLHFTPELLAGVAGLGVTTADVTLHVGLGTFKPIATGTIEEHPIHREIYEMSPATQQALLASRAGNNGGGRRIAVGTTTVRTIEDFLARQPVLTGSAGDPAGRQDSAGRRPHVAEASIYIYPPRVFRGVDALITNFHQPRSTLMCLVAAFLAPGSTDGIAWLRELYAEAIAREYRFFSYGDAMLIL